MRGQLAAIIRNLSPGGGGGGIENQVMRLLKKAKREIIKQYTSTDKGSKKSAYRTQKYGGQGELLRRIQSQTPTVTRTGGTIRGQVLDMNLLPFYWRTQEFGFKAAQWTWRQRFFIVAHRPKNKPSKRGDLFVLRSLRQSKGKHIYLTVSHQKGMKGRHFIRAGRRILQRGRISILSGTPGSSPVER